MKKLVASILMLAMILAIASVAMADSIPFHIVTSSTSGLQAGHLPVNKTKSTWYVEIDERLSNVSPTHRAMFRIHKGVIAISATWVCTTQCSTPHSYNAGYTGTVDGIVLHGRLESRDTGTLELHGTFHY